jgi:NAD(P)-dependent dehydrogenase (short-subunit alcohol dehydrogenase family)
VSRAADEAGTVGTRVVLVTAAANGIGQATALAFAARGDSVVMVDVDAEALAESAREVRAAVAGADLVTAVADVTAYDSASAAVEQAVTSFARLDVLVNAVGGSRPGKTVVDLAPEEWRSWIDLNLSSVFLMSKAALPHLLNSNGVIVNVASGAGIRGMRANPAYCAAKAGVVALTRAMAIDHGPSGVRVNCVSPGPIRTPLMRRNRSEAEISAMGSLSLTGRIGEPGEIAETIAWLASDAASYVMGQTIEVDGGPTPSI